MDSNTILNSRQDFNYFLETSSAECDETTYAFKNLTEAAYLFTRKQVLDNTIRANTTSSRVFSAFVVEKLSLMTPENIIILKKGKATQ